MQVAKHGSGRISRKVVFLLRAGRVFYTGFIPAALATRVKLRCILLAIPLSRELAAIPLHEQHTRTP
jgi:hypothetical protein